MLSTFNYDLIICKNLFEISTKENIFLSELSDMESIMLNKLSYYIAFVLVLQLISFLLGFGTNYEMYKLSLMLGILVINILVLDTFKSNKLKRVEVKNRQ